MKVPEAATRKKLKVKQDAPQSKSPNSSINSEQSRNKKVVEIIQGNANKVMNVHGVNIEDIEIGSGAMATSESLSLEFEVSDEVVEISEPISKVICPMYFKH